jgi:hypothetical protein
MHPKLHQKLLQSTNATSATTLETIQSLWSGYGEIARIELHGAAMETVVVKNVVPPSHQQHPRGWNTDRSHQRKVKSYAIEMHFYEHFTEQCNAGCRVPKSYGVYTHENERLLVLEDLDAAGFPARKSHLNRAEVSVCLRWLAEFHATFLHVEPGELWEVGTYWHLSTRPDELAAMDNSTLKTAAPIIDKLLNNCRFKTLVHGDAKVANFCFSEDGKRVAAVDFQYVGSGCGMKDVAYFLGSCLDESDCERWEDELLHEYFAFLKTALSSRDKLAHWPALENEWRDLFPVAWTDFHRFLLGWMPGHWKVNGYSSRIANEVVSALK